MPKWFESVRRLCKKYAGVISVLFTVLPVIGKLVSKTIVQRVAVALLSLSAAGFVGIVNQEDFKTEAYRDQVGIPTIGPGFTKGVKMGDTITVRQGLNRLAKEVKDEYEGAVHRCVKTKLYPHEYDLYVKVAWNIGPSGLCTSSMVDRLNVGDYAGACEAIKMWNKITVNGKKVPSRGLTNLREEQYEECMRDPNE